MRFILLGLFVFLAVADVPDIPEAPEGFMY